MMSLTQLPGSFQFCIGEAIGVPQFLTPAEHTISVLRKICNGFCVPAHVSFHCRRVWLDSLERSRSPGTGSS